MRDYLHDMLQKAAAAGLIFECYYDGEGEIDYRGTDPKAALKALEACDEMYLSVILGDVNQIGWALIVNGLEPDEVIADSTGWVSDWCERNL